MKFSASADWTVGTIIIHESGSGRFRRNGSSLELRTVARRKDDDSGWWLTDGSGLCDASANDQWLALTPEVIRSIRFELLREGE